MMEPSVAVRQNKRLTFKENTDAGRHGWLRLTPAYSWRLVGDVFDRTDVEPGVVLDPFGGTGTTGLAAAERGLHACLVDINPFLVWLSRTKTRNYDEAAIEAARRCAEYAVSHGPQNLDTNLWVPDIHGIKRWWPPGELTALRTLRRMLDDARLPADAADLLDAAFCRTLIEVSNAAFNHQSMSFRTPGGQTSLPGMGSIRAWAAFGSATDAITSQAETQLPGTVDARIGDARNLGATLDGHASMILTSPPYANRMSYIREMRPYMYWLRFIQRADEASALDWQAIGGTWGSATSRVGEWLPDGDIPLGSEFADTLARIRGCGAKNADLLGRYVEKYFHDMWLHFRSAYSVLSRDGCAIYVVGNSAFYGEVVPTQEWCAELMAAAGFVDIEVRTVRKRNSKKALFEYAVEARRP